MKSRLAILSMLVAGILLSTTGAGLAVSGLGGSDASVAQYATPTPTPEGGTLGEGGNSGGSPNANNGGTPGTGTNNAVQPARQVESGANGGQLPFTGFLAIPVLLGGVALLGAGMVLRHRTANERE